MTQGVDDVEAVAGLQLGEAAGAVAHYLDKKGQGAAFLVDVVHGDGATQHHVARALDEHLDELTRYNGLHLAVVLKHQAEVLVAQLLALYDAEIVYLFHIKNIPFRVQRYIISIT